MRTAGRVLAVIVAFAGFVAGGALGGCAALGLTAVLWGGGVLEGALGSAPDRSHPAFWFFLALLPLTMALGFVGAFFGWLVPLCYLTGARLGNAPSPRWFRQYLRWVRVVQCRRPVAPSEGSRSNSG